MRRLAGIGVMLILSSCTGNQSSLSVPVAETSEIVQRQLDLGIGYMRSGDYPRAKKKLNRALEIDPKNASILGTLGLLFQLEGEAELAEKYFIDAIRYGSESARIRNLYGAFLYAEGRYFEAIEQLRQASDNRFYPNRPSVFENLGMAYSRVNDKDGAEQAFMRAVQLNPEQTRALLELAVIRYEQQNYVESRNFYRRHIATAPKSPKALLLCTQLAKVFEQPDEEASCAEVLDGIYPSCQEYRKYRGTY